MWLTQDVNASRQPGENSCTLDLQFERFNLQRKGLKMSYSAILTLLSYSLSLTMLLLHSQLLPTFKHVVYKYRHKSVPNTQSEQSLVLDDLCFRFLFLFFFSFFFLSFLFFLFLRWWSEDEEEEEEEELSESDEDEVVS